MAIASDSNTVYIDTVLQASNARNLIDFVATNPAEFLSSGRLILFPYQKQEHGCTLCPENMCKGNNDSWISVLILQETFWMSWGRGALTLPPSMLEMEAMIFVLPWDWRQRIIFLPNETVRCTRSLKRLSLKGRSCTGTIAWNFSNCLKIYWDSPKKARHA